MLDILVYLEIVLHGSYIVAMVATVTHIFMLVTTEPHLNSWIGQYETLTTCGLTDNLIRHKVTLVMYVTDTF